MVKKDGQERQDTARSGVERDFGLSLPGFKRLSPNIPEPVRRQIVDFVSKCAQQTSVEVPEIELDELDDEWEEEEEE